MIELTVKTLDSQNHAFTVEDDLTVGQFKEKIADTVNIPADTQRIIYCGRLLQDETKLSDHDLNGKVVHLVQRPPPSNDRPNQRSESPPPQHQHRRIRGLEYLGSMRFPAGAFETNIMPPLPTHSLAASRLNVARRMLRRAETVLNALENPAARSTDQPAQEETQEEVTPIFEARVIVPNEADVLSSVQNILNENNESSANNEQSTQEGTDSTPPVEMSDISAAAATQGTETNTHSVSSTPEIVTPLATSSENLATAGDEQPNEQPNESAEADTNEPATNNANNAAASSSENISRTTEFAELLGNLSRFQTRFNPHFDQYLTFMREDPTVTPENARSTQAMINRVSEILHFLGHAYHSLSDIIVRVRTPPPRPLLCRPILVQHSAIVQAGIPIQVEAQINFSSDRNSNNASTTSTTTATQPSSTATTASNQTTTTTPSSNSGSTQQHTPQTFVGFPLIPGAGVRVETFHLPQTATLNLGRMAANRNNNNRDNPFISLGSTADILAQAAAAATVAAASNMTNNSNANGNSNSNASNASTTSTGGSAAAAAAALDPAAFANALASSVVDGLNAASGVSNATHTATANATNGNTQVTVNNPNVEFFMEVTPESITIDSVETQIVDGSQDDVLPGPLNPPPELIQSLMQMAGHLMQRGSQSASQGASASTTNISATSSSTSTSDSQTSSTGGAARATPFQNSQARGNTQTQPTTATHTRSTARPHVHLSQHAMQGFDPFLPCNSHHVTPRRRLNPQANNSNQQNATANNASAQSSNESRNLDQNDSLHFVMRNLVNTVRAQASGQAPQNASASTSGRGSNTIGPVLMAHLQNMQNMQNLSDNREGDSPHPTIAQLLPHHEPGEIFAEGENICTDLIMMLSRNMTVSDVVSVSEGRLDPLMRIRGQLRNFFFYRILEGNQSSASIDRAAEKIVREMQPLLHNLAILKTRDGIDIIRSVQALLRARLPNIIALVASRSPNSLKMVMDQLRTTAKHLCALALHASANGRKGVEDAFEVIVHRYLDGVPNDVRQLTTVTSKASFCTYLSNLEVPESILQPYIVRRVDAATPRVIKQENAANSNNKSSEVEPMQVDEVTVGTSSSSVNSAPPRTEINLADDAEPLPAVVLGSEPWHNQVPADWVPIIARDSQRQRRQSSQPPFSDAYLSGMPSKRRKIVTSSKPQGSLPQVITESVRRAVTATGLTNVAPIEAVSQAAGTDINIQSAYRDLLRSSVQSGLRDNEDFTPERFPNASNYFNNRSQ